jgi:hypothetical protein
VNVVDSSGYIEKRPLHSQEPARQECQPLGGLGPSAGRTLPVLGTLIPTLGTAIPWEEPTRRWFCSSHVWERRFGPGKRFPGAGLCNPAAGMYNPPQGNFPCPRIRFPGAGNRYPAGGIRGLLESSGNGPADSPGTSRALLGARDPAPWGRGPVAWGESPRLGQPFESKAPKGRGIRGSEAFRFSPDRPAPLLSSPLTQPPPAQGGGTLRREVATARDPSCADSFLPRRLLGHYPRARPLLMLLSECYDPARSRSLPAQAGVGGSTWPCPRPPPSR